MQVMNRARVPEDFQSAAQIVAGLTQPAQLRRAQTALTELQAKRKTVHAALVEAVAAGPPIGDSGRFAKKVRGLDAEIHRIDTDIAEATATRDLELRPFAAVVADALSPLRRAAIREAVGAIADLSQALGVLDAIGAEMARFGADDALRFGRLYRNGLSGLGERLARIAA